jgi:hypothetical protein
MPLRLIGRFTFVSHEGRLLQAHTDGEMHASQEVQNRGSEETWKVHLWSEGRVSLQNVRTERWLAAEPDGRAICNRAAPASWEQWRLYTGGDEPKVCLRGFHSRWLCAQPPGQDTQFGGEVIADRAQAGPWECFSMVALDPLNDPDWFNKVKDAIAAAGHSIMPILV